MTCNDASERACAYCGKTLVCKNLSLDPDRSLWVPMCPNYDLDHEEWQMRKDEARQNG